MCTSARRGASRAGQQHSRRVPVLFPMGQKTLLALNDEELVHVVIMAMTDDNPSHFVKHSDTTVTSDAESVSFDDVVFIALVHTRFKVAVAEALQFFRTRTSTFYNGAPWPVPHPKHGPFHFVTSISGIFTSEERLRFAFQRLLHDELDPRAETKLWKALYTFPCCGFSDGSNSRLSAKAVVNFAKVCNGCSTATLERREKTAGYRMSNMTIVGMLKVAPLSIVTKLFPEIFSPTTEVAELDLGLNLEFPHHQLVVSSAAYWGRIDVLEELFHTDSAAACNYNRKRGLLQYLFPNIGGGTLAALGDSQLQQVLVEAAVAGNRVDVLNWFTKTLLYLQTRSQRPKRLPTFLRNAHPHFFDVAWVAARRGSTDVLDLLYRAAKSGIHEVPSSDDLLIKASKDLPQHVCYCKLTVLMGLYILAFGGGSNNMARDVPCIGASQRWAQVQWQRDAWFIFELQSVALRAAPDVSGHIFQKRMRSFYGFTMLLYSPALIQAQMQKFVARQVATFAEWLIVNCHTKQAMEEVVFFAPGDRDSAEWVCRETKPDGFLAYVAEDWKTDKEDNLYSPRILFLQKKLDQSIKARALCSFHRAERQHAKDPYRSNNNDAVSRFEYPYAHTAAPCIPNVAATVQRAKQAGYTSWIAQDRVHYLTHASQYLANVQPITSSFGTLAGKLFPSQTATEGMANYSRITSSDCGIALLLGEIVSSCFDDDLTDSPIHHSIKCEMVKDMFYAVCVDPFGSTYFDKSFGRFCISSTADAPVWNAIRQLWRKSWTRPEDNEWLKPLEAAFCNNSRRA
jgi:hypothetical protein